MRLTFIAYHHSPVGWLKITATDSALTKISFVRRGAASQHNPIIQHVISQLEEYFTGTRPSFDIPLAFAGTAFQEKIWRAIKKIPYGKTWSYQKLTQRIGQKNASRAAGNATGKNPLCTIIPCHRVITSNGKLGGFSGSLKTKKSLLELEGFNKLI